MIEAEQVDFIRVPLTDMDEATHLYGEVLGLAARAKLEAAGLRVGDMWDSGVCQGAGVSDPAGNRILLHHLYAPYPDGTLP